MNFGNNLHSLIFKLFRRLAAFCKAKESLSKCETSVCLLPGALGWSFLQTLIQASVDLCITNRGEADRKQLLSLPLTSRVPTFVIFPLHLFTTTAVWDSECAKRAILDDRDPPWHDGICLLLLEKFDLDRRAYESLEIVGMPNARGGSLELDYRGALVTKALSRSGFKGTLAVTFHA